MMNRSVMQRQMFKYGGDVKEMMYGGDVKKMQMGGEVPLKDVPGIEKALGFMFSNPNMSTGAPSGFLREKFEEENPGYLNQMVALPEQMSAPSSPLSIAELANLGLLNLNDSQNPVRMQMGGDPMMAMQEQMPPEGIASMMPAESMPAAPGPDMTSMGVGEVDQGTMEQMLTEVAPEIGDPEQAEDFETMMNSVRGDEASVDQRRAELATLVGEEDAAQTPESVLALVQPVVQMSMVDQGIGGLAEQEMQQPVQGDMAGGIMSMMGG